MDDIKKNALNGYTLCDFKFEEELESEYIVIRVFPGEVSKGVHLKRIKNLFDMHKIKLIDASGDVIAGDLPSPCLAAFEIINERSEEKDREYGPFSEMMGSAAIVASEMIGKELTTEDFFKCLIAMKIVRLRQNLKWDTFVDAMGYLEGLYNYSRESKSE